MNIYSALDSIYIENNPEQISVPIMKGNHIRLVTRNNVHHYDTLRRGHSESVLGLKEELNIVRDSVPVQTSGSSETIMKTQSYLLTIPDNTVCSPSILLNPLQVQYSNYIFNLLHTVDWSQLSPAFHTNNPETIEIY